MTLGRKFSTTTSAVILRENIIFKEIYNLEMEKSLGADYVIDYTKEDFTEGEKKYDLIFDAVGLSSKSVCKNVLTSNGRYIGTSGPEPKLDELVFLKDIIEEGRGRSGIVKPLLLVY